MDLFDGRNDWLAAPGVSLPVSALRFTFSRGGGPGGQNVNKLNTRATLSVPLEALAAAMPADAFERLKTKAGARLTADAIVISAADSRSQLANRRACLSRLRHLLIESLHRPRRRRATRPSRGVIERRLKAKKSQGQRKHERRSNRNPPSD
ncbi:alternative ribosome rescue aminoacyl-tRNA hydrolase ArfB [Phycisphaerales bacterium AB-hyl4]|uniref:Alternative ribosome rescue aminoacyl-tRNA hydrolase ArfB n=1 Tax=Natronomicrosphaera hydrolytica TaxID=3242702 RepID=A0ABV4U4E8_9BACT